MKITPSNIVNYFHKINSGQRKIAQIAAVSFSYRLTKRNEKI